MSKKNRRSLSKRPSVAVETGVRAGSAPRPGSDFNPDYSSVKRDLRRIGILAGTFILLLIALAIVQRFYPLF